MRLTAILLLGATVALAACQPAADDDVAMTSGPAPEAAAAEDAATDATEPETAESDADEPAQQTAPPTSETGDMGEARPSEESVEPDSPTMFH